MPMIDPCSLLTFVSLLHLLLNAKSWLNSIQISSVSLLSKQRSEFPVCVVCRTFSCQDNLLISFSKIVML